MIQASDLKENLENQGITVHNSTMASTDAEAFCQSAGLKLVRKAVCHFSKTCQKKIKLNTAQTRSSLECSQHSLLSWKNVVHVMVMKTQKRKGSPLVATHADQPVWKIQQDPGHHQTAF